jgi:hypothetical protein
MTIMTKILAGGLGLAAIAAAAPASAQYQYGYYPPYGNAYGYYGHNTNMTQVAASQCAAAVEARLNNRVYRSGVQGILGAVLGTRTTSARVLTVSSVTPSSSRVRVRGLASSGQYAYNNSPYGYGYYGAQGYGYANAADLSFKCDVDYSGRVRNIDIHRRR